MLNIAVVGNGYAHTKRYIDSRFNGQFKKVDMVQSTYELINGDILHLCYDESGKDKYKSYYYDAIIIVPGYESLLDVLRYRLQK